ncbi:hypothetical protein GALMADRAFT_578753 [Galerina marginata CBS 339.88]|uniref:Uncharacterized protein n=1 Tax=Galerina marginata (strain CBS 339.88) TaxID=685588 RepID=A0A067T5P3_GALM3|nr:hypothetical protein GALMADRAFT_578753 [Galerina marginata CBS 339.88]
MVIEHECSTFSFFAFPSLPKPPYLRPPRVTARIQPHGKHNLGQPFYTLFVAFNRWRPMPFVISTTNGSPEPPVLGRVGKSPGKDHDESRSFRESSR